MPRITIIVTTYNRRQLLEETLNSILNQTYSDFELIVVDNNSNYDFIDFISCFRDARIKPYQNCNGGNIALNRNFGIQKASGEFIAFCDDDDVWELDKLQSQINAFDSNSNIGLVCTSSYFINSIPKSWFGKFKSILLNNIIGLNIISTKYTILIVPFITNSSVMIRKEIINQIGYIDENPDLRTVEDFDFWLRVSNQFPIHFINKNLIGYRCHELQNSSVNIKETKRKMRLVFEKNAPHLNAIQKLFSVMN
jgi:glycosyltransferase involved in cell wall biosynthesis